MPVTLSRIVGAVVGAVAAIASPVAARTSNAQTVFESGSQRGGVGTHLLIGVLGGRLELDDGGRLDAIGARAGVGFGELVQLTGFYWKSADISDRPLIPGNAAGGEVQLNLNAGFGLTPFLTAGAARLRADTLRETAAVAGAGLLLPMGPVLLRAAVHDYILGVSGLQGSSSRDGTSHNWMFSAGVTAAFGRGRPQRVTAARGATGSQVVRVSGDTIALPRDRAELRNYQSERRIEVPLPLEGSITIRYGPDAQPIVSVGTSGSGPQNSEAAPLVSDPALQNWLRQEIALQLAEYLRAARAPAGEAAPSRAATEKITDDVLATVLSHIDMTDARRTAELREELRRLLENQLSGERRNVLPPVRPPAATPGTAEQAQPVPVAPYEDFGAVDAESPVRAGIKPGDERRNAVELEARVRVRLAEVAATHPTLLGTAETDRGPALVVADAAFATDAPLLTPAARSAIAAALDVLELTDATIFVQGHVDAVATEVQAQRFSELRAEAVRSALVQQGLESGRVYAIGYGQARPVATNSTAVGRSLNRRVEIVVASTAREPIGDRR